MDALIRWRKATSSDHLVSSAKVVIGEYVLQLSMQEGGRTNWIDVPLAAPSEPPAMPQSLGTGMTPDAPPTGQAS